ncbi:MAG: hypothetical protein A3A73_05415 [Omnitrophica bacterium RIFCSPLOWO2_01_FULL_50_24]|nr:MAG: hypothetical protein A3A73_05415 [Omnitrophica bacterium RIFCSPLOWO2_01_FULL_50_24]
MLLKIRPQLGIFLEAKGEEPDRVLAIADGILRFGTNDPKEIIAKQDQEKRDHEKHIFRLLTLNQPYLQRDSVTDKMVQQAAINHLRNVTRNLPQGVTADQVKVLGTNDKGDFIINVPGHRGSILRRSDVPGAGPHYVKITSRDFGGKWGPPFYSDARTDGLSEPQKRLVKDVHAIFDKAAKEAGYEGRVPEFIGRYGDSESDTALRSVLKKIREARASGLNIFEIPYPLLHFAMIKAQLSLEYDYESVLLYFDWIKSKAPEDIRLEVLSQVVFIEYYMLARIFDPNTVERARKAEKEPLDWMEDEFGGWEDVLAEHLPAIAEDVQEMVYALSMNATLEGKKEFSLQLVDNVGAILGLQDSTVQDWKTIINQSAADALSDARTIDPAVVHRFKRILIVDDEPELPTMLAELLEIYGFDVTVATRGDAALALLDHSSFNLVVSDIDMPGLKGPEWVGRIPSETRPPVIFMSGENKEGFKVPYLQKPFSVFDLISKMEQIAQEQSLADARLVTVDEAFGLIPNPEEKALHSLLERVAKYDRAWLREFLSQMLEAVTQWVKSRRDQASQNMPEVVQALIGQPENVPGILKQAVVVDGVSAGTIDREALDKIVSGTARNIAQILKDSGVEAAEVVRETPVTQAEADRAARIADGILHLSLSEPVVIEVQISADDLKGMTNPSEVIRNVLEAGSVAAANQAVVLRVRLPEKAQKFAAAFRRNANDNFRVYALAGQILVVNENVAAYTKLFTSLATVIITSKPWGIPNEVVATDHFVDETRVSLSDSRILSDFLMAALVTLTEKTHESLVQFENVTRARSRDSLEPLRLVLQILTERVRAQALQAKAA